MRAFIAVDLSNGVKQEIEKNHSIIRQNCEKYRLTKIGNLHITLKFLGDINNEQEVYVKRIMDDIVPDYNRFQLELANWGIFKSRKGNIVWLGVNRDLDILSSLSIDLSNRLQSISKEKSFNFKPHITIARDAFINKDISLWPKPKSVLWSVRYITLYESVFYNKSVTYKEHYKVKL